MILRGILFLNLILIPFIGESQCASNFFNTETKVTWYGLDFSHSRYIGAMSNGAQQAYATVAEYKNFVIPRLNSLVLNEAMKYDLEAVFYKSTVDIDTAVVGRANRKLDITTIQTYDNIEVSFDTTQIPLLISSYEFPSKEGLGIIVFVEQLNKIKNKGVFYLTVFDIASKKVVFTERMEGRMLGFGFKNYCAGSINYMLDEIEHHQYRKWRKKYCK